MLGEVRVEDAVRVGDEQEVVVGETGQQVDDGPVQRTGFLWGL